MNFRENSPVERQDTYVNNFILLKVGRTRNLWKFFASKAITSLLFRCSKCRKCTLFL